MRKSNSLITGSCVCGGVKFEVKGALRPVIACHCVECRKLSGHYTAATAVSPHQLTMTETSSLRWYSASDTAERGFCGVCGSTLFWKPVTGDRVSIYAGCLDGKTGLELAAHIFVAEQGDYFRIDDDLPQYPTTGAKLALVE